MFYLFAFENSQITYQTKKKIFLYFYLNLPLSNIPIQLFSTSYVHFQIAYENYLKTYFLTWNIQCYMFLYNIFGQNKLFFPNLEKYFSDAIIIYRVWYSINLNYCVPLTCFQLSVVTKTFGCHINTNRIYHVTWFRLILEQPFA